MSNDFQLNQNESLSQNFANENESSLISQMTTQHSHNSYNSEMNGYLSGILKLNMNKNKLAATCREYKHLDDEWKFDVDNISVVEATQGNVFNDPNPKVYKHKSHS